MDTPSTSPPEREDSTTFHFDAAGVGYGARPMSSGSKAGVRTAISPHLSPHAGVSLLTALLTVGMCALLVSCGSSKPAYCSDRANLEKSVKEVPGLASSGNLSGLRTQASKIQTEASTLADSARSDFPNETSALNRDVDTLISSVKDLPANPPTQDYAKVGLNAATAVSSVSNFSNATNSKCS